MTFFNSDMDIIMIYRHVLSITSQRIYITLFFEYYYILFTKNVQTTNKYLKKIKKLITSNHNNSLKLLKK